VIVSPPLAKQEKQNWLEMDPNERVLFAKEFPASARFQAGGGKPLFVLLAPNTKKEMVQSQTRFRRQKGLLRLVITAICIPFH
jgi:hypothetical protein